LRHAYAGRPEHVIAPAVTALELFCDSAGFHVLGLNHADGVVPLGVERLAHAFERSYALRFKQPQKLALKRKQAFSNRWRHIVNVLQRSVKAIDHVQQGQDNLTFAAARGARAVPLNASAVVLEISQRAQVLIMLATQLVFEALDFRRLVPARAIFVLLWRFH
jgi:hypothetical protein